MADDTVMDSADVRFESARINEFAPAAKAAPKLHAKRGGFDLCRGRDLDIPKVDVRIEKGDTVGEGIIFRADLTDNANGCLFITRYVNHGHFLLDGELVNGDDACTVKAEDDGLCPLHECSALGVAADQKDGDFFWSAAASP
jgi:hypothetical protein